MSKNINFELARDRHKKRQMMSFKTSKVIVVKGKKIKERKRRHSKSYRSMDKLHLCLIRHSFFFFFFFFFFWLNRKQIEENISNVYIHRCLSHHTYRRTMSSFVKIRMCPWWLITTTSSVCIHVCSIDMRKHVSAIRTTTREKIMNYQWERKRDQRVVTDDTRVLMRQTAILGARRLLLLLALVCCMRAQLLVLTLNHVLSLWAMIFAFALCLSLPFSLFFLCLCVHVRACAA
jgi:hypothetical protein